MIQDSHQFALGWDPNVAQRGREAYLARGQQFAQAVFEDDRPLPPAFSLAQFRDFPFDQSRVGSCFANAAAQAFQIHSKADGWESVQLSRRLVWYQGRRLDGTLGSWSDGGSVTNAMAGMGDPPHGIGCCHEALWPYKPDHRWLEQTPTSDVIADAALNRVHELADVQIGPDWKRAIFNGHPVAIGIWWPFGWDTSVDSTGRCTGIGRGTYGHALAIIGWIDDWDGYTWWQVENSHGPIYHPLPAEVASRVIGYRPAFADKTHDFWTRDDWLRQVLGYGNAEAITAAGLTGFKRRVLDIGWLGFQ